MLAIFNSKHLALSIHLVLNFYIEFFFRILYHDLNIVILLSLSLLLKFCRNNRNRQYLTFVRNLSKILFLLRVSMSMIFTKSTNTSTSKTNSLKNANWASRHSNFSSFQNLKYTIISRESSSFCKKETTTRSRKNSFRKKTFKSFCLQALFCQIF